MTDDFGGIREEEEPDPLRDWLRRYTPAFGILGEQWVHVWLRCRHWLREYRAIYAGTRQTRAAWVQVLLAVRRMRQEIIAGDAGGVRRQHLIVQRELLAAAHAFVSERGRGERAAKRAQAIAAAKKLGEIRRQASADRAARLEEDLEPLLMAFWSQPGSHSVGAAIEYLEGHGRLDPSEWEELPSRNQLEKAIAAIKSRTPK